ncbi:MAG: STAS domain-containing protein [Gammaproteobacteria bacterium]|nr:MAG: STAS domain-containing protein [Gammaproteobacteria bacterium]
MNPCINATRRNPKNLQRVDTLSDTDLKFNVLQDGLASLEGSATFATVKSLEHVELPFRLNAEGQAVLEIRLDRLEKWDSACLALLVEWKARATRRRINLCYSKVPEQLRALARLSNLESLLLEPCPIPDQIEEEGTSS